MKIPEPSLNEPVTPDYPPFREIPARPWWCREITRRSVEAAEEELCDNYCRWPAEYKDPEQLWAEQCEYCRMKEFLYEVREKCKTLIQA